MKNIILTLIALSLFACKSKSKITSVQNSNAGIQKTIEEYYMGYVDEEGNYVIDEDYIFYKIVNVYDQSGKVKEVTYYEATGELGSKMEHFYDSKSRLIKTLSYDFNEVLTSTDKYIYTKNLLTGVEEFNPDGLLTKKTIKNYDNDENLVSEQILAQDGSQINRKVYENMGEWKVLIFYDESNTEEFRTQTKLNEKGDILERKVIYPYGEVSKIEFTYQFDSKGNWTQRKMSMNNDEVLEFTLRRIVYYE